MDHWSDLCEKTIGSHLRNVDDSLIFLRLFLCVPDGEQFHRAPPGVGLEGKAAFEGVVALADIADALVLESGGRVILQRRVGAEVLLSEGHRALR